jgi:hypothetical protein
LDHLRELCLLPQYLIEIEEIEFADLGSMIQQVVGPAIDWHLYYREEPRSTNELLELVFLYWLRRLQLWESIPGATQLSTP